ncbi:MAG TPA: DUF6023 family protein [Actinoplanes sp.]|nr:DUF6023 family protein [Actinoplanes sp.]
MTDERTRGIILYALAGVVLLGGGAWFFGADPIADESPELAAWRATAEESLPDLPQQAMAETLVLSSGGRAERTMPVDGGSYTLSMVCAGTTGQVRVRLSSAGEDSGRAVPCRPEAPEVDRLRVALANEISLRLSAENDAGGAVFRWRLERSRGF